MTTLTPQFLIVLVLTVFCGIGAFILALVPSSQQNSMQHPNTTAMFNALLFVFGTGVTTLFIMAA